MKVSTTDVFKPVTITLETQDEVDKMYALLANGKICDALNIDIDGSCWWMKLDAHKTSAHVKHHFKICELQGR